MVQNTAVSSIIQPKPEEYQTNHSVAWGEKQVAEEDDDFGGDQVETEPTIQVDRKFLLQFLLVYALVIAHLFLMAFTDPVQSRKIVAHILTFSSQLMLLLAVVTSFFFLTSRTFAVQMGSYPVHLREFRAVYITASLAAVLITIVRIYMMVMIARDFPYLTTWERQPYRILWSIMRLAVLAFYIATAAAAVQALQPRLYFPHLPTLSASSRRYAMPPSARRW